MKDTEYVKQLLATDYREHLPKENPYPDLKHLIAQTDFDFFSGRVLDQRNNGEPNRDGVYYQFFPVENKRISVHRFIVAVALGKWPPRDLDVHHMNSKPDDNRPTNLELVTRRDNNAARRAPLKDVADLDKANEWARAIPKIERKKKTRRKRIDTLGLQTLMETEYPKAARTSDISTVLNKYYSVPVDVSWTGRRKGKDDCYHEATSGIWYYVAPDD